MAASLAAGCGRGSSNDSDTSDASDADTTIADAEGEGDAEVTSAEGSSEGESDTGTCSDPCTQDNGGHACCAAGNGPQFFCGDSGECIPSSGCEAADCCTPGEAGDDYCGSGFGEGAVCAVVGDDGRCTIPENCAVLDAADCIAAASCQPVEMAMVLPNRSGEPWCISDAFEYMGCIPATGCGDAETFWCDAVGAMYWSPDTCGVPELETCDAPPSYEFCGG